MKLTESIFGFNFGVGSYALGLSTDYYQPVHAAGRRPVLASQDDAGAVAEAVSYGAVTAYRKTGGAYELPDYNLPPVEAAQQHWARCYGAKPPEIGPDTCLLCENEPNKNMAMRLLQYKRIDPVREMIAKVDRHEIPAWTPPWKTVYMYSDLASSMTTYVSWMGAYACEVGRLALAAGQRYAAFSWSTGEPEPEHWERPEMLDYLRMCAQHPDRLGIALHEYSLSLDIGNGYPWLVGRFRFLHEVCDRHGIARPTIIINEWGWHASQAPDPDTAMAHIRWAQEEVYGPHPNIKMAAIWTLQGGYDPIKFEIQKMIRPLGVYASGDDFGGDPAPPPPPPDPVENDLVDYLFASTNITTVLQYNIAGQTGTETHQSRRITNPNHRIIARQKGDNAEYWYHNERFIGLFVDTSPVQVDNITRFYTQSTRTEHGDILGAKWINRLVRVGDVIDRAPVVIWRRYDNCLKLAEAVVADQIRVIDRRPGYTNPEGHYWEHPCITLQWEVGGVAIERYTFAMALGLVEWRELNHGWISYLVETYDDRPPMAPPSYPACFPTPEEVMLYDPIVDPPPPPLPAFPLFAPYEVLPTTLRIRSAPSITANEIGRLPRKFIIVPDGHHLDDAPATVWLRSGAGWVCARLRGDDYLAPWSRPTTHSVFVPVVSKVSTPPKAPPFTLRWPADFDVVTQAFGANPQIYRRWGLPGHEGIDIAGAGCNGKPIYACSDGEVYLVHQDDKIHNYGTHVRIRHSGGYKTVYAHLSRTAVWIGDQVEAGQVIGYCGSTGNSTGPHLHLTLKRAGAMAAGETEYPGDIIDPTPYLRREVG